MSVRLVDDHLLGLLLLRRHVGLPPADHTYTTGCWYYRLCHAYRSEAILASLSGPLADLPHDTRQATVAALFDLPGEIGMLGFRTLAPMMAELVEVHRLNLLALEALAAAAHLDATVCVAERNEGPRLREACAALGITHRALRT